MSGARQQRRRQQAPAAERSGEEVDGAAADVAAALPSSDRDATPAAAQRSRMRQRDADRELALRIFHEEREQARGGHRRAQRSAIVDEPAKRAADTDSPCAARSANGNVHGEGDDGGDGDGGSSRGNRRTPESAHEQLQRLHRQAGSTERYLQHIDGAADGTLDVPVLDLEHLVGTGAAAEQKADGSLRARDELKRLRDGTYINCDLRYFNLAYLRARLGNFDVVLVDPPWRIAGSQRDSTPNGTMLSNNRFALNYRTLSNQEILAIDVEALAERGLCFLWVVSSQIAAGLECLAKWGYEYIDRLTWVKKRRRKLHVSHGYHFLHSTETCLVGIKRPFEYIGKVSNDAVFAEVREKSRKPDQLYHIIDAMAPGAQKVELFARNHNIRKDWLSLGNELGEQFTAWRNEVRCDTCGGTMQVGERRFKSRSSADCDLCHACIELALTAGATARDDWFEMANMVDEPVYHEYFECDRCGVSPIWGTRFHGPDDEDLCEQCVDDTLAQQQCGSAEDASQAPLADWAAFETPRAAGELPVHRNVRCQACLQCPIIGYRFACAVCHNMSLCQKCFFGAKQPRAHTAEHDVEIIVDPQAGRHTYIRCDGCRAMPIVGRRFRCDSCYNLDLCEACHAKRTAPASHPAHRAAHTFTCITDS